MGMVYSRVSLKNLERQALMTRKKFGLLVLAVGLVLLLAALYLLFKTTSFMAPVTLLLSVLVNTFAVATLMAKDRRD